ncbi:RNA-guided endonuclease InsQ/TnpB family protein [Meiothermus granaticius]|uniref:Transposase, IS605 OrfB family n=1 Tax=Meiothermus granaticius NBRC 107808 TaxID=1227551 RepID=A0A399F0N8_9DEIN|nr:RNA-guided endonuclease TnpB family protein [Meiothermus granaticius]RIH90334.1 transposase, IS605 OrfB family [Meiothermus granaticius NBRC 107808]GEM88558.1 transposase [Meiothermus granaticius NBRC 107808]
MLKAFAYRIYPTKPQLKGLEEHLNRTRELYNAALQERRDAYKKTGRSVTAFEQMGSLVEVKEGRPEYRRIHAHVLQGVITQLDRAFQGFFRRVKAGEKAGYPRFKSKDRWDSFHFKQVWDNSRDNWFGPGKPVGSNRIRLPNIGDVRIKWHRPLAGRPKTLTIKRDGEHWYAVYVCEVEPQPLPATGGEVGIDLGVNPNFLVTSDGEFVPAPHYYRKAEAKLRRQQRVVSRRKRGGGGRKKAVAALKRLHRKVRNQRKDFHHKTARKLLEANDVVYHENLSAKAMSRSRLSKSILDMGWGQFLNILYGKAAEAGRRVVGVNPAYTSQICSGCGHVQKVPIGKPYECGACGLVIHRDVNAALNILRMGRGVYPSADGQGLPLGESGEVAHARRPQKPPALAVG